MGRMVFILIIIMASFAVPFSSYALTDELLGVFNSRPDLQGAFDATKNYQAISNSPAGFLIDLDDWARQYGWQEYNELSSYASEASSPVLLENSLAPVVTAEAYIILDNASGKILLAKNAENEWPIASLTKLATAKIALDGGLDGGGIAYIETQDEVGGARLGVSPGTTFLITDLLKATLVASANNAANAVARATGIDKEVFVGRMNEFATELNLSHTNFADPTGIELGNVSTAREMAYIVGKIFANENIRKICGLTSASIKALSDTTYARNLVSTNWLLYDHAYDDVYVTAGKTGFLDEAGWNLVVQMHPMGEDETRSLMLVLFGSDSRRASFDDAHALAWWTWEDFEWK